MSTLLNLLAIQRHSNEAFELRCKTDPVFTPDRCDWDVGFEAGFLRAMSVLGLGKAGLSAIDIEHIATTFMAASGEDYAKDIEARPHSWVLQAMRTVALVYENADTSDALQAVVNRAIERNEVPTISLLPLKPLYMGNYQFDINVRPRTAKTPPVWELTPPVPKESYALHIPDFTPEVPFGVYVECIEDGVYVWSDGVKRERVPQKS